MAVEFSYWTRESRQGLSDGSSGGGKSRRPSLGDSWRECMVWMRDEEGRPCRKSEIGDENLAFR